MAKADPQKRPYQQKKRAALTSLTRDRIVEATIDLHGSVGPAQTTYSMIAGRAGIQRHTLYAHFPDERSLFMACSGTALERDPLPDATGLRSIAAPAARLNSGLGALYDWYGRNAQLIACVLRDAEHHALTREIVKLSIEPGMVRLQEILSEGLNTRQRPLVQLAVSFYTWRLLVLEIGPDQRAAIGTMLDAVFGASTR